MWIKIVLVACKSTFKYWINIVAMYNTIDVFLKCREVEWTIKSGSTKKYIYASLPQMRHKMKTQNNIC